MFAAFGLILMLGTAAAGDIEPKVLPDRIADVQVMQSDPFPGFANFGWRAFIALDWPALTDPAHRGEPDRSKVLGDPGPRVWETFKSRYEVFQRGPGGQALAPAKWRSYDGKNPCGPAVDNRTKTLSAFSTFADLNEASGSVGVFANPLVAQNHTYTRFEVRFNEMEFDSIVDHKWYVKSNLPTAKTPGRFNVGSIVVKAAWRILTDADTPAIRKRYYIVKDAQVLDVAKTLAAKTAVCSKRDVALVGLHIVIKTPDRAEGIWASFEQIDNVPPIGTGAAREPDAKAAHVPYSYNDGSKNQSALSPPFNSILVLPLGPDNPPKLDPDPMQVIREHPINPKIMAMNQAYWALPEIRDSVWVNYMLVALQWPTMPQPVDPQNDGHPFPIMSVKPKPPGANHPLPYGIPEIDQNLANSVMETYYQSAAWSCMTCHQGVANVLGRDFNAFITNDANNDPAHP